MRIPITQIKFPGVDHPKIFLLRLDVLHPIYGGNKLFKLKWNIEKAIQLKKDGVISFGGKNSNHLAALANFCYEKNIPSVAIIRGDEPEPQSSTLKFIHSHGMQLEHVSREEYRKKENSPTIKQIIKKYPNYYLIPEGGANLDGALGCVEISNHIPDDFEYIVASCGTGTTLAGLIAGKKDHQKIIGISALKGAEYLNLEIQNLIEQLSVKLNLTNGKKSFELYTLFHCGGFAKINEDLLNFKNKFEEENNIELDYIYTSKMLYALKTILTENPSLSTKKIIAVHSGGIQGNQSMEDRYGIKK